MAALVGICDVYDGWDDGGPNSGRVDDVTDFVDDLLESWGFEAPNWDDQMPPGYEDARGVYTSNDDTIHLNPDLFEGDPTEAVQVALHEGMHATMDQLGWQDDDLYEELQAGGAGYAAAEDLAEGCENPTESGQPSDMPTYPWESPVEEIESVIPPWGPEEDVEESVIPPWLRRGGGDEDDDGN